MRLRFLEISNFLSYGSHSERIDFDEKLNLLVGPNGSGKTNILRALELARNVIRREEEGSFSGSRTLHDKVETEGQPNVSPRLNLSGVRLGVAFTTDAEKALAANFWIGCVESAAREGERPEPGFSKSPPTGVALDSLLDGLCNGDVVLTHRRGLFDHWELSYEFDVDLGVMGEDRVRFVLFLDSRPNMFSHGGLVRYSDSSPQVLPHLTWRSLIPQIDELPRAEDSVWKLEELLPNEGERTWLGISESKFQSGDGFRDSLTRIGILDNRNSGRSYYWTRILWLIFQSSLFSDIEESSLGNSVFVSTDAFGLSAGNVRHFDAPLIPGYLDHLARWKTGSATERKLFLAAQQIFKELRGADETFDVVQRTSFLQGQPADQGIPRVAVIEIRPVVLKGDLENLASRAGSGAVELIRLSTLLSSGPESVILLDEPLARLHPEAQRRFTEFLGSGAGQVVMISHAPGLVPLGDMAVDSIGSRIHRVATNARGWSKIYDPVAVASRGNSHGRSEFLEDITDYMKRRPESKSMLFSSGVIFVSGDSEYEAFPKWLQEYRARFGAKEEITFFNYSGDGNLHKAIQLACSFGIPWVAFVDGKSLKPQPAKWNESVRTAEIANKLWLAFDVLGAENEKDGLSKLPQFPDLNILGKDLIKGLRNFGVYTFASCWNTERVRSREGCPVCGNWITRGTERHVESFEDFAGIHLKPDWNQVCRKIPNKNQKVSRASELVSVRPECPQLLKEFFDFVLMRFRERK